MSPRRSSASCACAASMACSPPFTATYTSVVLHPHGPGQRGEAAATGEQQVHAAREPRRVVAYEIPETRRRAAHLEPCRVRDAGTSESGACACFERVDL